MVNNERQVVNLTIDAKRTTKRENAFFIDISPLIPRLYDL